MSEVGLRTCQEAIAKGARLYFNKRLSALQRCRNQVNAGKSLFLDEAKTLPLADPTLCQDEFKASQKILRVVPRTIR